MDVSQLPQLNPNHCRLVVVRHGQSQANHLRVISGITDHDLSDEGIRQAHARAATLSQLPFAAGYASNLKRAIRTAEIILQNHRLSVTPHAALRERQFGEYENKSYELIESALKNDWLALESLPDHEKFTFKSKSIPEMESDHELAERFFEWLAPVAPAHRNQHVLAASHSGVLRAVLTALEPNLSPYGIHSIENTGFFILDTDGSSHQVVHKVGIKKI